MLTRSLIGLDHCCCHNHIHLKCLTGLLIYISPTVLVFLTELNREVDADVRIITCSIGYTWGCRTNMKAEAMALWGLFWFVSFLDIHNLSICGESRLPGNH